MPVTQGYQGCDVPQKSIGNDGILTDVWKVHNDTDQVVHMYWINFNGQPEGSGSPINPGETSSIEANSTWASHPFMIKDATKTKCLAVLSPTSGYTHILSDMLKPKMVSATVYSDGTGSSDDTSGDTSSDGANNDKKIMGLSMTTFIIIMIILLIVIIGIIIAVMMSGDSEPEYY